ALLQFVHRRCSRCRQARGLSAAADARRHDARRRQPRGPRRLEGQQRDDQSPVRRGGVPVRRHPPPLPPGRSVKRPPTIRRRTAALLLAPAAAFAGAYAIPNENARSLALSQADVAAQTGPEAAYQNAAALAGQEGLSTTANLEMIDNRTYWFDPTLG